MSPLTLHALVEKAAQKGASDLHLVSNKHPIYRIHGELHPDTEVPPFSSVDLKQLFFEILMEKQKETFSRTRELDFSYKNMGTYQYRVNMHMEKGQLAATIRITATGVPTFDELGLPSIVNQLTDKRKGLVLLAGTAGSGKSTTLTYMIDKINRERKAKIITIEDPIEYVHDSKQSLIIQREVGSDTDSFASALKYALRQDPDVVVIGEMRDPESISMALTTAETGHLVFSTVHAPDAIETLNRIIDAYGPTERDQVCTQLASNMLAIIYQILIPNKEGTGRVLATEVLLGTMAVRNLIRRKDFVEVRGHMESDSESGMYTLETCLSELAKKDKISDDTALMYARFPNLLKLRTIKNFGEVAKRGVLDRPQDVTAQPMIAKAQLEDDKTIRILILDRQAIEVAAVFKANGYTNVSVSVKGKEADIKIVQEKPDLLILDTFLPDVDSFDFCQRVKDENPLLKVIIATSKLEVTDPQKAQTCGADDFVIKTAAMDLVFRSIRKLNIKK